MIFKLPNSLIFKLTKKMENIETRAKDYLEDKPTIDKLYGTTDGFLFEKKYDATTHAKNLNEADPEVKVFGKEEITEIQEPAEEPTEETLEELKEIEITEDEE